MAPAYCVGQVCTSVEQYPQPQDLDAAAEEQRRLEASELTRRALTASRITREFQPQRIIRPT